MARPIPTPPTHRRARQPGTLQIGALCGYPVKYVDQTLSLTAFPELVTCEKCRIEQVCEPCLDGEHGSCTDPVKSHYEFGQAVCDRCCCAEEEL